MFPGLPLEGSKSHGFEDFRRSVSVPALAKERKLATQALMRATESGNVHALRKLALEAGAEMSGCRALNRLGNDPIALLQSSGHLTQEEQRRIRRQFAELPELVAAAEAVRASGAARPSSRYSSKRSAAGSEVSGASSPRLSPPTTAPTTQPPASATHGARPVRTQKAKLALTSLAGTVEGRSREKVCEAALADPRLLRAPQELSGQALPAMARALRSEELALKAVTRNPGLLRVEALKFKKVLPVLAGILGGQEEAAYAMAVQPEMLEAERPQQLRESLRALVDCLGSMKDALWLVVQTLMPPSVKVSARAWCREDVVGEYRRMEGREVDDRPMYLKPASAMRHLGDKAKDVYMRYSAQAAGGSGGWLITPVAFRKLTFDPRAPSKSVGAATMRAQAEDRDALALAASTRTSPDQVPAGMWSFKQRETKAWTPDTSVEVADAGRPRTPGLLMVEPPQLRSTFSTMKEAIGLFWREADADGHPMEDVRFASCAVAGDATHARGEGRFRNAGGFTQDTNGYVFLQLPVSNKAEGSELAVRLTAWEPICVTLLYCDKTEEEKAPPVDEEPAPAPKAKAKAKDKDKGKDKGGKGGKAKEEAEAEQAIPPEPPKEPHVLRLEGSGFRPPRAVPALPELEGLPPVKDVLTQCFPRGQVEFFVPSGPGKLKLFPLVFVRAQVCGRSGRSGAACEVAKAKAGELLLFAAPGERRGEPGEAGGGEGPRLQSAGELGYNGYSFLRAPAGEGSCEPSEVLLRVDSGDRIQVILAQFRLPPAPAAPAEGADAARTAEAQEPSTPSQPSAVPPEWVSRDRWQRYGCKIPLAISTDRGEQVSAEIVHERTFEAGDVITLHGWGQDVFSVAFFRRVGDPRPDPLRALLLKKPSLLATGDRVAGLLRRLRVELGEALARDALMATPDEWAGLCLDGDEAAIRRWARGHKAVALAQEVGGAERARALLEQPDVASATSQQLAERCEALREVLGGNGPMLEALARRPQLLAAEATAFEASRRVLLLVLGSEAAQAVLRRRPDFLARGPEIAGLFSKLRERFPMLCESRLRERSEGEWARWPEFVGRPKEALHEWMGRLSAEERAAGCRGPA